MGRFPQFGSYLLTNESDLRENFVIGVCLDQEVSVKLGSHPDFEAWSRIRTSDLDQVRLGGGMCSLGALVVIFVYSIYEYTLTDKEYNIVLSLMQIRGVRDYLYLSFYLVSCMCSKVLK